MTVAQAVVAPRPSSHQRRGISWLGGVIVTLMLLACLGSLPWTLARVAAPGPDSGTLGSRRYEVTRSEYALLPPFWAQHADDQLAQLEQIRQSEGRIVRPWLGTDRLGRSMLVRCLVGGAISLGIGLSAAAIAVVIGTLYGAIAGFFGGRLDAFMMRIVDILYSLPYILLVVLLAVAVSGLAEQIDSHGESGSFIGSLLASIDADVLNLLTLLVAIGGVSWLTLARVIRGQVLSLKQQPFMEACRAIGVPVRRQFTRHLLPNLLGPIIVYATLTVPAAILSESFLSFLGIGVQEPVPSWGNLAASGLSELNMVRSRWWLLLWPCLFIAIALLALNFMGEGLRERFDPKRRSR